MSPNPIQRIGSVSIAVNGNEIRTDIICTTYSDRHFVLITQMKKVGTLIQAWSDKKSDGNYFYEMVTLLGRRDDPLLNVYARQIIEKISAYSDKPLLLGISLVPEGRGKEIFEAVLNNLLETTNTWGPTLVQSDSSNISQEKSVESDSQL